MIIWIDADACPRVITNIIIKASERLGVQVRLVANKDLSNFNTELVISVMVPKGSDAADDYIASNAEPTDLVVTADVPLAARIVAKGGVAIDPRGEIYTDDNVGDHLSFRYLLHELSTSGEFLGGPAQLGRPDRQRFASSLDSRLTRMMRAKSAG